MSALPVIYRPATIQDALSIRLLAIQVFLDTYAANGIRANLAREALGLYDADDIAATIAASPTQFIVAELDEYLVGFTEIALTVGVPQPRLINGLECKRLYIQRHFKRMGIGQQLLHNAEFVAAQSSASCVWLTTWINNTAAIRFYQAIGYADVGRTPYCFEGATFENIIFHKQLAQ
jgi:diamine N-acetyltransferase